MCNAGYLSNGERCIRVGYIPEIVYCGRIQFTFLIEYIASHNLGMVTCTAQICYLYSLQFSALLYLFPHTTEQSNEPEEVNSEFLVLWYHFLYTTEQEGAKFQWLNTNEQDEVNRGVVGIIVPIPHATEQEGAPFQCLNTNAQDEVKRLMQRKKNVFC